MNRFLQSCLVIFFFYLISPLCFSWEDSFPCGKGTCQQGRSSSYTEPGHPPQHVAYWNCTAGCDIASVHFHFSSSSQEPMICGTYSDRHFPANNNVRRCVNRLTNPNDVAEITCAGTWRNNTCQ